ncbi:MAG: hypothetical protein WD049_04050, partial [Candidatus Paceibacterota bacterium]
MAQTTKPDNETDMQDPNTPPPGDEAVSSEDSQRVSETDVNALWDQHADLIKQANRLERLGNAREGKRKSPIDTGGEHKTNEELHDELKQRIYELEDRIHDLTADRPPSSDAETDTSDERAEMIRNIQSGDVIEVPGINGPRTVVSVDGDRVELESDDGQSYNLVVDRSIHPISRVVKNPQPTEPPAPASPTPPDPTRETPPSRPQPNPEPAPAPAPGPDTRSQPQAQPQAQPQPHTEPGPRSTPVSHRQEPQPQERSQPAHEDAFNWANQQATPETVSRSEPPRSEHEEMFGWANQQAPAENRPAPQEGGQTRPEVTEIVDDLFMPALRTVASRQETRRETRWGRFSERARRAARKLTALGGATVIGVAAGLYFMGPPSSEKEGGETDSRPAAVSVEHYEYGTAPGDEAGENETAASARTVKPDSLYQIPADETIAEQGPDRPEIDSVAGKQAQPAPAPAPSFEDRGGTQAAPQIDSTARKTGEVSGEQKHT